MFSLVLLLSILTWYSINVSATSGPNLNKRTSNRYRDYDSGPRRLHDRSSEDILRRQNSNTSAFLVNGRNIPDVDFDLGESYAGLLPVSQKSGEDGKLWFWYFPSTSKDAGEEIVIWCMLALFLLRLTYAKLLTIFMQ